MDREQAKVYAKLSREDLEKINKELAKNYDVLCAYANGATLEVKTHMGNWIKSEQPSFAFALAYRVKPVEEAQAEGAWKPRRGEHYYYVNDNGSVIHTVCSDDEQIHDVRFNFRNCFKTQEEACSALDRVRAALKGEEQVVKENLTTEPLEKLVESLDEKPLTEREAYAVRQLRKSYGPANTHFLTLSKNEFDFILSLLGMMKENKGS